MNEKSFKFQVFIYFYLFNENDDSKQTVAFVEIISQFAGLFQTITQYTRTIDECMRELS